MVVLSNRTKKALEKSIGLSFEEIVNLDFDEEVKHVETKTGKPLRFSKKYDSRKLSWCNPLLSRKRIRTMEDVNKKIDSL